MTHPQEAGRAGKVRFARGVVVLGAAFGVGMFARSATLSTRVAPPPIITVTDAGVDVMAVDSGFPSEAVDLLWLQGRKEFFIGFCSGVLIGTSISRRGGVQVVCCGHAGPIGQIGCCALASREYTTSLAEMQPGLQATPRAHGITFS